MSETRTAWDINLIVGIPFSRWGARPFVTSPIPYGILPTSRKQAAPLSTGGKRQNDHPLRLALKWRDEMKANMALTRAKLARREGLSRARVTQVLSLLQLPQEIQDFVTQLADAKSKALRFLSERRLRRILSVDEPILQRQVWNETLEQFKGR